jgi:hypothetical protein
MYDRTATKMLINAIDKFTQDPTAASLMCMMAHKMICIQRHRFTCGTCPLYSRLSQNHYPMNSGYGAHYCAIDLRRVRTAEATISDIAPMVLEAIKLKGLILGSMDEEEARDYEDR